MDRRECRAFLDRWFTISFGNPEAGKRHAAEGLAHVEALGRPPDLYARALAIAGSSCRQRGELEKAEAAYRRALEIYETLGFENHEHALDAADLWRRIAYLRMEQRRYDEALAAANHAALAFAAARSWDRYGRAVLTMGTIQLTKGDQSAITTLSKSLRFLDANTSWEFHFSAVYNLAFALSRVGEPTAETLETALSLLTGARLSVRSRFRNPSARYTGGFRRKTPPDALLRFLQGRILALLGQHPEARELLESAREDLIELEMPLEAAMVSIELAECYLWLAGPRRWQKIEQLCREVLGLLAPVPGASEAMTAYQLLQRAVAAQSAQAVRRQLVNAREKLGQR
ncbi:MAG: hypothetical protein HC897_07080 [Thermoanaerobaculia bacterium]|nr:hypothetical protein [Thermoanaerobaculia bacterium]